MGSGLIKGTGYSSIAATHSMENKEPSMKTANDKPKNLKEESDTLWKMNAFVNGFQELILLSISSSTQQINAVSSSWQTWLFHDKLDVVGERFSRFVHPEDKELLRFTLQNLSPDEAQVIEIRLEVSLSYDSVPFVATFQFWNENEISISLLRSQVFTRRKQQRYLPETQGRLFPNPNTNPSKKKLAISPSGEEDELTDNEVRRVLSRVHFRSFGHRKDLSRKGARLLEALER